jgi:protoheme IX farnesyltransferase
MSDVKTTQFRLTQLISLKLRDYAQLFKFRLASLVVFSAAIGFLMAANGNWLMPQFILFCLAGFLVTASSNALNQVIEKDYDLLMTRTMNRPLPQERMTGMEALLVAGIFGVGGISIFLIYFNPLAAIFSALSLLTYAFIYTPLKRFSPIAVFVGAIPGALPPLIGWVSITGKIETFAILLFGIQFLWQFPHFWSIAWVSYDDYMKAGYKLLPSSEGRTKYSAIQNVFYILALIPMSLVPAWFGFTGFVSSFVVLAVGILFLFQAIKLYKECSITAARKLMFSSFFYLPIVQLALFLDRIS